MIEDRKPRAHTSTTGIALDGPCQGEELSGLGARDGLVVVRHVGDGSCWLHVYRARGVGRWVHGGSSLIRVAGMARKVGQGA